MPEIERIDLTLIMLRLRAFEYTKIPKFPLGSPSKLAITHALGHLVQLGAIDPRTGIITPRIGRMMAALPLGPELSRCLIAGFDLGCQDEVLSLCSMLTVRPVFSDWEQQKKRANSDSSEDLFRAEEGDLVTLVNVYRHFIDGNKGLGWCQRQKLIYGALCKAKRIYSLLSRQISYLQSIYDHQIIPIVSDLPFSFGSTSSIKKSFNSKKKDSPDCTLLLRAICLGFSANSAILMSDGSYKVVDCNKSNLAIHPSSVLFARKPTLLVFTDVLETKKAYMHYVSAISDPRWLF